MAVADAIPYTVQEVSRSSGLMLVVGSVYLTQAYGETDVNSGAVLRCVDTLQLWNRAALRS